MNNIKDIFSVEEISNYFFESGFLKKPLLSIDSFRTYAKEFCDFELIDRIIFSSGLAYPELQLLDEAREEPTGQYIKMHPKKIHGNFYFYSQILRTLAFEKGLSIENIDNYHSGLKLFCDQIKLKCNWSVKAQLFFSPPFKSLSFCEKKFDGQFFFVLLGSVLILEEVNSSLDHQPSIIRLNVGDFFYRSRSSKITIKTIEGYSLLSVFSVDIPSYGRFFSQVVSAFLPDKNMPEIIVINNLNEKLNETIFSLGKINFPWLNNREASKCLALKKTNDFIFDARKLSFFLSGGCLIKPLTTDFYFVCDKDELCLVFSMCKIFISFDLEKFCREILSGSIVINAECVRYMSDDELKLLATFMRCGILNFDC